MVDGPALPTVLYDDTCGFCSHTMRLWRERSRGRIAFVPSASGEACRIGGETGGSVRFVETDGTVRTGAGAVFALMARCGHPLGSLFFHLHSSVAPFRFVSERGYGFVARRRYLISRVLGWRADRSV